MSKIELEFKIDRNDKPLIYIAGEHESRTSCLIDTGANMPVWFIGWKYLSYRYPAAYKTDNMTIINGIGNSPIIDVPIWIIPCFRMQDDSGNLIVYNDLPVAVLESSRFAFDMIIPLTMLNRMDFMFSYSQSAVYGILKIFTSRDRFFARPTYLKDKPEYLNKIQIFVEGELI